MENHNKQKMFSFSNILVTFDILWRIYIYRLLKIQPHRSFINKNKLILVRTTKQALIQ